MRTVTQAELPENCRHAVLIKSSERKRQRRSGHALEKTLLRCREIHAEQDKLMAEARARCEREGFSAGFQCVFNNLLNVLSEYETLQIERRTRQRQQLQEVITQALHDPIVIERIVTHLHEHFDSSSELTLILPAGIPIPEGLPHVTCLTTADEHITLQSGTRALRFPINRLSDEWLAHADSTQDIDQKISMLIPMTLNSIMAQLRHYTSCAERVDKGENA